MYLTSISFPSSNVPTKSLTSRISSAKSVTLEPFASFHYFKSYMTAPVVEKLLNSFLHIK
ncbi:hypothetical protein BIV60_24735 [Bacillus sp. MUM 116]|nr:hypothetical protein BIV60_24735 [Bacillus sp. MUM 116]